MHRADRASGNEMTDDEVKRRAASVAPRRCPARLQSIQTLRPERPRHACERGRRRTGLWGRITPAAMQLIAGLGGNKRPEGLPKSTSPCSGAPALAGGFLCRCRQTRRLRSSPRSKAGWLPTRRPRSPSGQAGDTCYLAILRPRHCNNSSTSGGYFGRMNQPAPKRRRGIAKQGDLLRVWLDLLNHVDNPLRRRAAKFRQTHRPRRDLSNRRTSCEGVDLHTLRAVRTYNPQRL